MSDKDRSSPPSSSGSLPSDQLLERLLGGIAKGLDGLVQGSTKLARSQDDLVQGNLELRQAFAELRKFIGQHSSRQETRVADLQVAIDVFTQRIEAVVEHQKSVVGATVTARDELKASKRALDDSKEILTEAVKKATGAHSAYPENEEGPAPLIVRQIAVRLTNFIWPVAVRRGPDALRWGFSLIAGSSSLAWLAHYIWTVLR